MTTTEHYAVRPRAYFYWITLVIILVDQLSKRWIDSTMFLGQSRFVVSGLFNLTYVANDGIAFGLFQGRNFIMGIFALVILVLVYLYARSFDWKKAEVNIIGALIFGGAVGNLTDRFRKGYVIDFLDFYWRGWHWPAFNVADACISVSVAYIILRLLWQPAKEN